MVTNIDTCSGLTSCVHFVYHTTCMKGGRPTSKFEWNRQQRLESVQTALAKPVSGPDRAEMKGAMKALVVTERLKEEIVAQGGNVTAAAKAAGVSYAYAKKLMPRVREDLIREFNEVGADIRKAAQVVADAMEATVPVRVGSKVEASTVPDHGMRLKAFDHWKDVTGARAPSRSIQTHTKESPEDDPTMDDVRARLARLRELEEMTINVTPTQ